MKELTELVNTTKIINENDIFFRDIISETTDYEIIPFNIQNNKEDKELFLLLTKSAEKFLSIRKKTEERFRGNRINDVGKRIEIAFLEELKKTSLGVELLSMSGYPDMKIMQSNNRITYLESKAVSKGWDSTFRSFYYSTGKKINSNGRHLLISWDLREEANKYWDVIGWKLLDLSNLKLKIKIEFNSSNRELYQEDSILATSNK